MKKSKLVIGLYVIAGLLGILTIYMVISSVSYLSSYAQSYGMGISDLGGEAYSYILTNSVNYLIYAILVFAAAKILEQVTAVREQLAGCCCTEPECGEEPDSWSDAEVAEETAAACECSEASAFDSSKVPPLYTSNTFIRH